MNTAKIYLLLLCCCCFGWIAAGAVKPAQIFSDHMVLQRDQLVPVWGTATPGAPVSVTFGDQRKTAVAAADGQWRVTLDPMPACDKPRDLILEEGNSEAKVVIGDVLMGDVWLGSGQSNMAWTMEQVQASKSNAAAWQQIQKEIDEAPDPRLRLFHSGKDPRANAWQVCSRETVPLNSAVGYCFAREVVRGQQVPVGFITAALGGTPIENWISREAFRNSEAFKAESPANAPVVIDGLTAGVFYDSCIRPWASFALKGILWYQGENNLMKGDSPSRYSAKMELLISSWRKAWGREDLPFYYVQLSQMAYSKGKDSKITPEALPAFQDLQRRLLALPHTGMAMTADAEPYFGLLHPINKWDVGQRLWLWAARDCYGRKDVVPSGPLYKRMEVRDGKAVLFFDYVGGGLVTHDNELLSGFQIRGEDGVYHPGTAAIAGQQVVVSNPNVKQPAAVRYNWDEMARRSLFNREGLPASPFCTEPGITDPVPAATK